MDWLTILHIVRNIVFGLIFLGVGLYLIIGQLLGYRIDFPGDSLNYIFGVISIAYGVMRLVYSKKHRPNK